MSSVNDIQKLSQKQEDYYIAFKNALNMIVWGIEWKKFNEPYRKYMLDDSAIQIFFGGGSSGKSHFVFQRTILDVWLYGRNFLVARQKKNSLENSVYAELKRKINDFGLQDKFDCKKNPMSITCKENGRQILFIGLDDIESVKSIVPNDGTFTDVIIEEATEIKESDFEQLRIRQRGTCYKKYGNQESNEILKKRTTLMFNPINKTHWIYKRFFVGNFDDDDKEVRYTESVNYETIDEYGKIRMEHGEEEIMILKTTYRDNKFLSPDDIIKLQNTKDPVQKDVYVNGNWGSLGKNVYQKNRNWFVEDLKDKIPYFTNIRNGLDFGGAIDPHAYIKFSIDKQNNIIYIFDEFKMNEITVDDLWANIKPKVGTSALICDRNEDMIRQLKETGANPYRARKGKNSVINGINWVHKFKIIVDKRCKETMYEFENYTWKTDKYGNAINVPIDKDNHLCVSGDTIISTPNGNFKIEELVGTKGSCYSYDAKNHKIVFDTYTCVDKTGHEMVYRITMEDGKSIECTKNHRFYSDNGYESLEFLNVGDLIMTNSLVYKKITSIEEIEEKDVYNMNVMNNHNFIGNGLITHNCDALRYGSSYDIIKTSSTKTNINPYRR